MGMPMETPSGTLPQMAPQMAPLPELPATAPNDGWMRLSRRTEKRGVEVEGGMNKRTAPALPTGPPHAIGPATLPAPPPPLPNGQPGEYLGGRVLPEGEFWKIFPVIQVLNYTEPTRTPNTQRISIDRKTAMGNPFIHNNTQGERDDACTAFTELIHKLEDSSDPNDVTPPQLLNDIRSFHGLSIAPAQFDLPTFKRDVNRILEMCKAGKPVALVCHCAPSNCHGYALRQLLIRFTNMQN